MKRGVLVSTLVALIAGGPSSAPAPAQTVDFYETWSDGRGEVNTYEIVEERYGELRTGHAILVYVAEELDRRTYVKVESGRTPVEERMFVIKLNHLRRFTTGIYDYAVMTTVFSVAASHLGHHPFQATRVVHTTQEWCGQVFHRLDLARDGWREELRSYFEAEGDRSALLPSGGTDLEDNLWVWIRELGGEVLAPGGSRELRLYPALWEARKSHRDLEAVTVRVAKGEARPYDAGGERLPAFPWSWTIGGRTVTVHVAAGGGRRILGWEDSRGGRGRLVRSERLSYWEENGVESEVWRARYGLPGAELDPPGR